MQSGKTRVKRPSVRLGEIFQTSNGPCEVIEYKGWECVVVKFEDGYIKETQVSKLKNGTVRNPYYPTVEGVGYLGEGPIPASDSNGSTKLYNIWNSMLRRCYNEKQQLKQPSYIGASVCAEWHNFQKFASWFEVNKVDGWVLDKDLIGRECKIYSPETCCFIPAEINSFLTKREKSRGKYPLGVVRRSENSYAAKVRNIEGKDIYKSFKTPEEAFYFYKRLKEDKAKALANKYADKLSQAAYLALMNYEINITD